MTGKGMNALVLAIIGVVVAILVVVVLIGFFSSFLPWYLALPVGAALMGGLLYRSNFSKNDKIFYFSGGMSFLVTLLISLQFVGYFLGTVYGLVGMVVGLVLSYKLPKFSE